MEFLGQQSGTSAAADKGHPFAAGPVPTQAVPSLFCLSSWFPSWRRC